MQGPNEVYSSFSEAMSRKSRREVTTGHERVAVTVRRTAVTPSDLPQSALHYVIRTRQHVLLDDASVGNLYSEDEYLRQKRTRSVLLRTQVGSHKRSLLVHSIWRTI